MVKMEELRRIDKKRMARGRVRTKHRWTEEETNILLDNILYAIKSTGTTFERPTARKFYNEYCTKEMLTIVDWVTKKHKMRHLKASYIKAKEWKETVASELFESDKQHISARIKKLCPYYNKLDEIFAPILNSDPIGPMVMDEDGTVDNSTKACVSEQYVVEEIDSLFVPKNELIRSIGESRGIEDEESGDDLAEDTANYVSETNSQDNCNDFHRTANVPLRPSTQHYKHSSDIEMMKFYFEKEKFEKNYNLEKEKFEFEKTKFYETQKLRKYELDKQIELKKLEIQKDERMQRLRFEDRSFE